MAFTYEELKAKTVNELREIAKDVQHDAVQGALQMNKDHLLPALCRALGIDADEHHAAQGIDTRSSSPAELACLPMSSSLISKIVC